MSRAAEVAASARPVLLFRAGASLVLCTLFVLAAMLWLDRPIALFMHEHFGGVASLAWLGSIPNPFPILAALVFLGFGAMALSGRRPGEFTDVMLRAAFSLVAAVTINTQLKALVGRTWPETWFHGNPSFIRDGVYAFFPYHGGLAFQAFPSGHMTSICAVIAVLWVRWPRGRWCYALAVALVAAILIGADMHWLSDVIAGAYVGTGTGLIAASFRRPALGETARSSAD